MPGTEELQRAQGALRRAGVDLALLAAPSNVCYLSGWEQPLPFDAGWEMSEGVVLVLLSVTDGAAMLLCPDQWQGQTAPDNRLADARYYGTVGRVIPPAPRSGEPAPA